LIIMHATILLVPALAAVCLGVAIPNPQVIVTGTNTLSVPDSEPTWTIVIPCYDPTTSCSPRTVTVAARDEQAAASVARREAEPQVIITASRTVIIGPTPTPTTSSKKRPTHTRSAWKRQSLGSPSRSVDTPEPTTSPTSIPWWWWPPPPVTTVTVTITTVVPITTAIRSTSTGDGITRTVTTPLTVPINKRQVLGSPTRTVLVPTTIVSISDIYVTETDTKYVTVPTTVVSISDIYETETDTKYITVSTTKVTTLVTTLVTTQLSTVIDTITKTIISTTTTTYTEEPTTSSSAYRVTSSGDGSSISVPTTLPVPIGRKI